MFDHNFFSLYFLVTTFDNNWLITRFTIHISCHWMSSLVFKWIHQYILQIHRSSMWIGCVSQEIVTYTDTSSAISSGNSQYCQAIIEPSKHIYWYTRDKNISCFNTTWGKYTKNAYVARRYGCWMTSVLLVRFNELGLGTSKSR